MTTTSLNTTTTCPHKLPAAGNESNCPFMMTKADTRTMISSEPNHTDELKDWERRFLKITQQAYQSLLSEKKKRLSEWTLMSHLTDKVAEITQSDYVLLLKKPYHEERLDVIGLSGDLSVSFSETIKQYKDCCRLTFPMQGSHALFVTSFQENTPLLCNEMVTRTGIRERPMPHPVISKALCHPVRYGDEAIGELILGNRSSGFSNTMFKPLSGLCSAVGHLIKLYESIKLEQTEDSPTESGGEPPSTGVDIESDVLKSAELSLGLFRVVKDGIIILDRDMMVVSMNPSSKALFGVDAHQNIHISELIPDNSSQKLNWYEVGKALGAANYNGKALAKRRIESDTSSNNDETFSTLIPISFALNGFYYKNEPFFALTITNESLREDMKGM